MEAYVINLDKSIERWKQIQRDFAGTDIRLKRWSAMRGSDLTDEQIKGITTDFCYHFCSNGAIGCWLSHWSIWKHIVEKKIPYTLILEDDAYPVEGFNKLFPQYWSAVPNDWDLVYLGYTNSENKILETLAQLFGLAGETKTINDYVIKPGFPVGLFAYAISYNGAVKLLQNNNFDKITYHIDIVLPQFYKENSKFKVYAFVDNLINPHNETSATSTIQLQGHPLLMKVGSKIKISNNLTLDTFLSSHIIHHRKSGFTFNLLVLSILVLSILVALIFNSKVRYYYLGIVTLIFIGEWLWFPSMKISQVLFELFVIALVVILFGWFRDLIAKKISTK